MKNKFLIIFILFFVNCGKRTTIKRVARNYINTIEAIENKETNFNVFITEIEKEDQIIYRLNAMSSKLVKGEDLPYDFYKYRDHFVFLFNSEKVIDNEEQLEKLGLFKTSDIFILEHNPEWILIKCNKNKNSFLFKEGWYRPLNKIQEIQNFKCL